MSSPAVIAPKPTVSHRPPKPSVAAAEPVPAGPVFTLRPWRDPVMAMWGHELRSTYVERFWLPLLGPSAIVIARRLGVLLAAGGAEPLSLDQDTFAIDVGEGARLVRRTFDRLASFGLAAFDGPDCWWFRTRWPDATLRSRAFQGISGHALRNEHSVWLKDRDAISPETVAERARWAKVVRAHAAGISASTIDIELREMKCDQAQRVELVNWVQSTPPYGRVGRVMATVDSGAFNG